ncbi:NADH-cytochrome b5 reductase [Basidiobolus ranarum]|uniref:NADH-cytochrome b5 reductase n=1 Tax=Basidiobolus ranarum TaxID=34480 RepID=A0ABR2VYA7_9FUNG
MFKLPRKVIDFLPKSLPTRKVPSHSRRFFYTIDEFPSNAALVPGVFTTFTLSKVTPVNSTSSIFRFALPPTHCLGLNVSSCIVAKLPDQLSGGTFIARPYTPISDEKTLGYFELLIKRYPNGPLSEYFHGLLPGEMVEFQGPFPKFSYKPNEFSKLGMIAGGTGITPMYQLLRKIFQNSEDKTQVSLIFANKREEDILLREEILFMCQEKSSQFKVHFAISENSLGEKTRIDKRTLEEYMPSPALGDARIFICGPPEMVAYIAGEETKISKEVGGLLKSLGYSGDSVYRL